MRQKAVKRQVTMEFNEGVLSDREIMLISDSLSYDFSGQTEEASIKITEDSIILTVTYKETDQ